MKSSTVWIVVALAVAALGYYLWSRSRHAVAPPAMSTTSGGVGGLLGSVTNAVSQSRGLLDSIFGKPAASTSSSSPEAMAWAASDTTWA